MRVFFDASVLFSAMYSHRGASYQLVKKVAAGQIYGLITQTIILEVEDHLDKFPPGRVPNVHSWIAEHKFIVRKQLLQADIEPWRQKIADEDAHVVAGAILMGADYLLSLDKKHLLNQSVQEEIQKVQIISPRELLFLLNKKSLH